MKYIYYILDNNRFACLEDVATRFLTFNASNTAQFYHSALFISLHIPFLSIESPSATTCNNKRTSKILNLLAICLRIELHIKSQWMSHNYAGQESQSTVSVMESLYSISHYKIIINESNNNEQIRSGNSLNWSHIRIFRLYLHFYFICFFIFLPAIGNCFFFAPRQTFSMASMCPPTYSWAKCRRHIGVSYPN